MTSLNQDNLHIEVSNVGPIIEGQIDLKQFNVFVGPSNTGKSMLAILIYAIHRVFQQHITRRTLFKHFLSLDRVSKEFLKAVLVAYRKKSIVLNSQGRKCISVPVNEKFARRLFEDHTKSLIPKIEQCFGSPASDLIRCRSRKTSRLSVLNNQNESESWNGFAINLKEEEVTIVLPPTQHLLLNVDLVRDAILDIEALLSREFDELQFSNWNLMELYFSVTQEICRKFAISLTSATHYLPADRTGIMNIHSLVVASVVQFASKVGRYEMDQIPKLTGVLSDYLDKLLVRRSHRFEDKNARQDVENLAAEIESTILSGRIQVEHDEQTDYPRFKYAPKG